MGVGATVHFARRKARVRFSRDSRVRCKSLDERLRQRDRRAWWSTWSSGA